MRSVVINIVKTYVKEHLYRDTGFDVFEVWHCYILGNEKWLLATTLSDNMYYEVTFNKAKNEIYLDAYHKVDNHCYGEATME